MGAVKDQSVPLETGPLVQWKEIAPLKIFSGFGLSPQDANFEIVANPLNRLRRLESDSIEHPHHFTLTQFRQWRISSMMTGDFEGVKINEIFCCTNYVMTLQQWQFFECWRFRASVANGSLTWIAWGSY